jgi:hypothetical protein
MANTDWELKINLYDGKEHFKLTLDGSETSILSMLRMSYDMFEARIRTVVEAPPGSRPAGIVDEALHLLRCLVMNRLDPIYGNHLIIHPKQ